MKRYLSLLLTVILTGSVCFAEKNTTGDLAEAIQKYKSKNYVGCIQDTIDIAKKDPSNAVAHYYQAISYANIGKKEEAVAAYQKVIALSTNTTLTDYATRGELCLTDEVACQKSIPADFDKVLDSFIKGSQNISDEVQQKMKEMRIEQRKQEINKEVDDLVSSLPTNDEIAQAVKTLAKAGINPMQIQDSPYTQMQQALQQNPEYMQLQMMLGNNNQNSGADFMGMIPFLLGQRNNSANADLNADMIKNMMMSSMMGAMSTTLDVEAK